jgi:hypothetical protein
MLLAEDKVAGLVLHEEASVPALAIEDSVEAGGDDSATFTPLILGIYEGSA